MIVAMRKLILKFIKCSELICKYRHNKALKRNKNSWLRFASLHIITNSFCPLSAALYSQASVESVVNGTN